MVRFIPNDDRDDEFAWICSEGHWNRSSEQMCRQCRESKPTQPEILRELLERVHDEHPRSNDND